MPLKIGMNVCMYIWIKNISYSSYEEFTQNWFIEIICMIDFLVEFMLEIWDIV